LQVLQGRGDAARDDFGVLDRNGSDMTRLQLLLQNGFFGAKTV